MPVYHMMTTDQLSCTFESLPPVAPLPSFQSRVVPVVVIRDLHHAVPLALALLEGGIDVIEITLRSDVALQAIEAIANQVPEMVVGAGTITHDNEVSSVLNAGARFGLSPGFTWPLLASVRKAQLPFIPGVASPSEAMQMRDAGFTLLKCFPAMPLGGPDVLRAWSGPLPELRFCPTGGIAFHHLVDFLSLPNVAMVGGSWLTPEEAMKAHDWQTITQKARQACLAAALR